MSMAGSATDSLHAGNNLLLFIDAPETNQSKNQCETPSISPFCASDNGCFVIFAPDHGLYAARGAELLWMPLPK